MKSSTTTTITALLTAAVFSATGVAAVTTEHFAIDSAEAFSAGELDGTSVESTGLVRLGAWTKHAELVDIPIAYSAASRKGVTYVGTGTNGMIFEFQKQKLKKKYDTGELLVSSLAFDDDGALYAGTLPNGRIFKIDPKKDTIDRFSKPEGAEHIWSLRYDSKRRRLIAGTGPKGGLFAIDASGQARLLHESEAPHIMSLTGDGEGTIYAGTSDSALVLKVMPNDKVRVVHDFPGNEITSIDFWNGQLAVAANEFPTKPGTQFKPPTGSPPPTASGPPGAPPRAGKGQLWRVGSDGRVEQLLDRPEAHFTAVEWGTDGSLFAGGGKEGHVFKVQPDGSYAIWADVEERQVLALSLRSDTPVFVTGDGAAIYWIEKGAAPNPVWTSDVLDSGFGSQWGRLTWRGSGKLVFQTRSGNSKEPNDTWSVWSKKQKGPGPASSPPGRFAQVRAFFPRDGSGELRAVELYYLPQNQRARVSTIKSKSATVNGGSSPESEDGLPKPSTALNLSWAVDNPDGDALRYRLFFRQESQAAWRPMFLGDVVLNEAKYKWDTGSIPDGYYVIKVEVSDEEANPQNRKLYSNVVSQPILVDNHPPRIDKLRYRNGRVEGQVVDAIGPIARIQASIDAGPWQDIFPLDLLLDSKNEAFEMVLPEGASRSPIVAIRAFDAAGNQANREIVVSNR